MPVTIHSPFRSKPRISRVGFIAVLDRQGSFASDPLWGPHPRQTRPDIAGQVYDAILDEGGDPAVYLAICGREHTFGTNRSSVLWRMNTRSWGNQRSIRHPDVTGTVVTDPVRGSQYVRFNDVRDSARDAVYRVNDMSFAYAGAVSIRDVLHIWAPSSDSNNPDSFAQYVVARINEWASEFPPTGGEEPVSTIFGVPFRRSHIPWGNRNRPGGNYRKTHIINHETGNSSPGANAEMHRQFTHNGGGVHNVSFQYVVDDKEIVELLPPTEVAWHGGDGAAGTCNRHGIGIEICVNADGDWNRALEHAAKLNAWLLGEHDLTPPDIVWQHNHCSGKNCPARLRAGGWSEYVERIVALHNGHPEEAPLTLPQHPDLDAEFHTGHGFAGYMRWLIEKVGRDEALMLVGYPITGEFDEDGITVQYTERMRFEWHPGSRPNRYDVLFGRTGAEVVELRAENEQLKARIAELEAQL